MAEHERVPLDAPLANPIHYGPLRPPEDAERAAREQAALFARAVSERDIARAALGEAAAWCRTQAAGEESQAEALTKADPTAENAMAYAVHQGSARAYRRAAAHIDKQRGESE
jgi:hypothetical protein